MSLSTLFNLQGDLDDEDLDEDDEDDEFGDDEKEGDDDDADEDEDDEEPETWQVNRASPGGAEAGPSLDFRSRTA